MTMLSFRIGDDVAESIASWTQRLGIDRSALLRDALRRHLAHLASTDDIALWVETPPLATEFVIEEISEWGPAEDWSDWA